MSFNVETLQLLSYVASQVLPPWQQVSQDAASRKQNDQRLYALLALRQKQVIGSLSFRALPCYHLPPRRFHRLC